jgi:Zn-finger nucleic acid-binding protein
MSDALPCPECGKPVAATLAFCPFCGASVGEGLTAILEPTCPRCRQHLESSKDGTIPTEACHRCGGVWLDRADFVRAQRKPPPDELPYHKHALHPELGPYLACVRCGRLMNRKNFAHVSGVLIDECGRHGVWLDAGELDTIRRFVADGGLDRMQDRELEKHTEAIRALASEVQGAKFLQRLTTFWNPLRWFFGG